MSTNAVLQEIINDTGINHAHIMKVMSLSYQTVYSWITNHRNIPQAELERLAMILRIEGIRCAATDRILLQVKARLE